MDRTKNRSDAYQWVLVELPCAPDVLTEVADNDYLGFIMKGSHNDELLDLKEKLRIAFWRIVSTKLTSRQQEVMRLVADGYTQTEIAKRLNVNQSSITKSINGNCDYRNGRKYYGGSKRKIQKIIEKDDEIQDIISRIQDLESGIL